MVQDRKRSSRPIAKKVVHLFAGVAHCICGNKMYVASNAPKYVGQKCRNKIPITGLEGILHEQLKCFFLASDEVAKYLQEADKSLQTKQQVLDVLIRERQQVGHSMDRAFQLHIDGHLSADGFATRYKPLEERCEQLDEEIPPLQAELDFAKINYLSQDQMLTGAHDLYTQWPNLPHDEKRKVTESIVQKVVIGKGEIDFDLCYLPSAEEMAKGQRNLSTLQKMASLSLPPWPSRTF